MTISLYLKVDSQCELETVVCRLLTTLATVYVPWRNLSKSRVWNKFSEGSTLIFGDIRISLLLLRIVG